MAIALDLWHPVAAPPAVPYRYGLFSVVQPRTADLTAVGVDEHWRLGVTWQSQSCFIGSETVGACIGEVPPAALTPDDYCAVKQYDPFTVYAYNNDAVPGRTLAEHQQDAIDRLLIAEQTVVESHLMQAIDNCAGGLDGFTADLTDYPLDFSLGWIEQALANRYGGQGVIYMDRQTATLLWENLRVEGGKLVTTVGTPVVAFGGYNTVNTSPPGTTTGIFATGPLVLYRGDVDTREAAIDKAINRVSYIAQRDYVIGWDCTCISAGVRLAPTPI